MLGIQQEALAIKLGDDWTKKMLDITTLIFCSNSHEASSYIRRYQ
jgi:hypothetical protein